MAGTFGGSFLAKIERSPWIGSCTFSSYDLRKEVIDS